MIGRENGNFQKGQQWVELSEEAGRPLCEPLRFAAYLLGHLDGRQLAEGSYALYVEQLEIVRDALTHDGMTVARLPDGSADVDIPFTSETLRV